jgi:ribosome-associated protein
MQQKNSKNINSLTTTSPNWQTIQVYRRGVLSKILVFTFLLRSLEKTMAKLKTNKYSDDVEKLKELILNSLENNKAENPVIIDLKGKSDIAKYMIVVSGRSDRHIKSLAEKLSHDLKQQNYANKTEGKESNDWVLIDTFEIIVHIFKEDARDSYSLEELWQA